MATIAVWGVPGGLIGARVYSLATSWGVDTSGHWYRALRDLAGRSRDLGRGRRGDRRGLPRGSPPPSAAPAAPRLHRTGLRPRPGHRALGQLLQPGAVRAPVRAPLGGEDRQPGRALSAPLHLPAHLPLRVHLGSDRAGPGAVGRAPVPDPSRLSHRRLCVLLHLRALLDRVPAHRPRPPLSRSASQRLDQHRGVRGVDRGPADPRARPSRRRARR